jgi:predicted MFS family arabinose efflux permease
MRSRSPSPASTFSPYQRFVVAVLAFLQFTIILDFMMMGPLGALLLRDLHITTTQFGFAVSVYAWSAGVSGLLAAGFADKFDRKKLLLFFYCGFLAGTLLCGLARSYGLLLFARIVTGVFGGVVASITMAIIADLFPLAVRGRVMGTVQTAFAASQVLGLPFALYLSNRWDWQAPFIMVFAVSSVVGAVIAVKLKPIDAHLKLRSERNAFAHLLKTFKQGLYLRTFAATMLLVTGGYMLMPFGSTFVVNNLEIPLARLPLLFMMTGVVAFVAGPLLGRLADRIGKYRVFCIGSALAATIVAIYCNLGVSPFGLVVVINSALFVAITARMITAMALTSAVPDIQDRGAFMSVNSSLQQFAGGLASSVAGIVVVQRADGHLAHYDLLGYVVAVVIGATVALMYPIQKAVMAKAASTAPPRPLAVGPVPDAGDMPGLAANDGAPALAAVDRS